MACHTAFSLTARWLKAGGALPGRGGGPRPGSPACQVDSEMGSEVGPEVGSGHAAGGLGQK